jgi:hypothetical protein
MLTLEQRERVEDCEKIVQALLIKFFGKTDGLTEIKETRLWNKFPTSQFGDLQHSGRVDRVYHDGDKALILEFKSLPGEVADSPTNAQLRDQAVLVAGSYKVPTIGTAVIQPLVTHDPEVCVYQAEDLMKAEMEMHIRVALSNDPAQPRIHGEIQCKFCRATGVCPEYQKWASGSLPMVPASIVDTPVAQWTDEQCGQFLDMERIATKWLDDTHNALRVRLKAKPGSVKGYYLRDGAEVRKVKDPQALFDRFRVSNPQFTGDVLSLFMKSVNIGNEKFRDSVAQLTGLKGQKLDDLIDSLFAGIVDIKRNQASIVKDRKAKK